MILSLYEFINHPSESEIMLVDSLYMSSMIKSYEQTKKEILKIPLISTFDRINFYLFKKYTMTILDGIEIFEGKLRDDLKDACRKIITYCKE